MLRDTDVPTMMLRVEATLDAAARSPSGAHGVMRVAHEGDHHLNVGKARQLAGIELEFPASSDRALVGTTISFLKRLLRRALRWYVTPMIHQQTRFNHAAVDLFEGVRLSMDRLARRLDGMQPASTTAGADLLPGCRTVIEVGQDAGADPVRWPDGTDVRSGDPADQGRLRALEPASVDGVLAHAGTLDAPTAAGLVEAAFAALAPGGKLAVLTTDAAPVPPAALAWAAAAAGFVQVRQEPVEPDPGVFTADQSLADELDRVTRLLSRPKAVAVRAVRPRTRP